MPSERVERWLAKSVASCPWCDRPVQRTNPRGLDYLDRICHLGGLDEGDEGPCPICGHAITRRDSREETALGLSHKKCVEEARRP
jgi:hypothetical protein